MPQAPEKSDRPAAAPGADPVLVEHGDMPKFCDAVIDHVIQKTHDAVDHYNGGRHLLSMVEISFAVEECSKLKSIKSAHAAGKGMTSEGLRSLRHHWLKFGHYEGAAVTGRGDASDRTRLRRDSRALYGLVALRELVNYVEFRNGETLAARKIFEDLDTLRQFSYCAVYWAVSAMLPMLTDNSIYGTSVLFPFCRAGAQPSVPEISKMFNELDELRRKTHEGGNVAPPLNKISDMLGGTGPKESFAKVYAALNAAKNIGQSALGAVPALASSGRVSELAPWLPGFTGEDLVVVFAKTSHTCAGAGRVVDGYCDACLAYIGSPGAIGRLNERSAGLRASG